MRSTRILVEGILLLAIGVLFGCRGTYVSNLGSAQPHVAILNDVDANQIQDLEEGSRERFISLTTDFLRKHGMLTSDYQPFSLRGPVVFSW